MRKLTADTGTLKTTSKTTIKTKRYNKHTSLILAWFSLVFLPIFYVLPGVFTGVKGIKAEEKKGRRRRQQRPRQPTRRREGRRWTMEVAAEESVTMVTAKKAGKQKVR